MRTPLAAHTATTTEKAKEAVTDAAITTKVKTAFAKDKQVSAIKINVDTDKGVVKLCLLVGTCRRGTLVV